MNAYKNLIKAIPVLNQSTIIKKKIWRKFSYNGKKIIEKEIFGKKEEVELSRNDIICETNIAKKILMVLMWGYPTGGRGNNIQNILTKIDKIKNLLMPVNKKNITRLEADNLIKEFAQIQGLGISTWSKFLFFFEISIDAMKCQIFDAKIVESLNKKQFSQLGNSIWVHDIDDYYRYIELLNKLSIDMEVSPEQIELFLFYYNLSYKFK